MTVRQTKTPPIRSLIGGALLVALASSAPAQQASYSHPHDADRGKETPAALVKVVRDSTARFRDVRLAEAAGYSHQFGCVTGDYSGAMGMHFVNFPLVLDGKLDATQPEIVIYEPMPNGRLRLIGADYLVFAAEWDAANPGSPPQLMGQLLHLFESPNRFGLPAFYTLHVWAWKESPTGTFVNWHENVSCDAFDGTPQ
jgi:hypothetical protein